MTFNPDDYGPEDCTTTYYGPTLLELIAQQQAANPAPTVIEEGTTPYRRLVVGAPQDIAGAMEREVKARHDTRVSICGTYVRNTDGHTGRFAHRMWLCDIFRECPRCLERRADATMRRMYYAYTGHRIVYGFVSKEQAEEILKDISSKHYLRCPVEDGVHLFIENVDDQADYLKEYGFAFCIPESLDFSKIVYTPEGQRMTGKLGAKPIIHDGQTIIVTASQIMVDNITSTQEMIAMQQAINETADSYFEPVAEGVILSPEELMQLARTVTTAMQRRDRAFVENVKRLGGKVKYASQRKETLEIKRIQWINYFNVNSDLLARTPDIDDEEVADLLILDKIAFAAANKQK